MTAAGDLSALFCNSKGVDTICPRLWYCERGEVGISENKIYIPLLYISTLLFCLITGIILVCQRDVPVVSVAPNADLTPLLIIDPGHGGADGGAVAADGTTESGINLSISLKIKSLSDLLGIRSIILRDAEDLPYPENAKTIAEKKRWDQNRRLELINSQHNAVLISIHQNFYPDARPFGPQVLYNSKGCAEDLGEFCHDALNKHLCPDNRRVAIPASDKIYLMKKSECPSILIECGFMSNENEMKKLLDPIYQNKLSAIILASYLGFIC